MSDHHDHDHFHRQLVEYFLSHLPQSEYIVRFPAQPTEADNALIIMQVSKALHYHKPLYFLAHHDADVNEALRKLATAMETYGHDGDDEEAAAWRLARRIGRDHERRS